MLSGRAQIPQRHAVWKIPNTVAKTFAFHESYKQCMTTNDISVITTTCYVIRANNLVAQCHHDQKLTDSDRLRTDRMDHTSHTAASDTARKQLPIRAENHTEDCN
jgi:hypothetical protein